MIFSSVYNCASRDKCKKSTMPIPNDLLSMIKNKYSKKAMSIIKNGSLHNAVDEAKNTLLHYAAVYRNPRIVQFLIDCGSYVNAQNNHGQTPLIETLKSDLPCKQVIQILLEAGANIDRNVWMIVQSIEWLNKNSTLELYEILKIFLEQAHNIDNFFLIRKGNKKNIKLLLKTKLDLSKAYGERGVTLVHELAMNHNPGVIELLHGQNFNVNIRDKDGCTPLMYAASHSNASAVEFLLSEGANIDAQDEDEETALYAAINDGYLTSKNEKAIQILLEHGANIQTENVYGKSIFNLFLEDGDYESAELPVAHLALQKARGSIIITDNVRSIMNEDKHLRSYFEYCQHKLLIEIYPKTTVFDVLTASDRKLERALRNEEWASDLNDFYTLVDYFDRILVKRFKQATRMVKLRRIADQIVCKLMKIKYNSYPYIVDEIISFLEEKDLQCLMLIQSELSCL